MKRYIKASEATPDYVIKRIVAAISIKKDKCDSAQDKKVYNTCIDTVKKVADDLGIRY